MSELLTALDHLLARATTNGSVQELQHTAMQVYQQMMPATDQERIEALNRLSERIAGMHLIPAAHLARICGALVETGGDPDIAGPVLFSLAERTLEGTVRFRELCQEKARADGLLDTNGDGEDGPSEQELAEKYFDSIHLEAPQAAYALLGEHDTSLSIISHLARSKKLRSEARDRPALLELSEKLDQLESGGRSFLTKMLLMLDDEPLLVLDTDQFRGYVVTFSEVPDNFMMHTLLMAHLLGDPEDGWIEGSGFDLETIRGVLDSVCDESAPTLTGAFNLWNYTGLNPDGTLPEPDEASDHWIWNEGVPTDIATFEGQRVIVLGQPPYSRSWPGGSIFRGLSPKLVVEAKLTEEVVQEWLLKLAKAATQP